MKTPQIAFENEMIITDNQGRVVNKIGKEKASRELLKTIGLVYPKEISSDRIIGELDACQVEIKNSKPHLILEQAQEELLTSFEIIEKILKEEFGLQISPNVVPNQDFIPEHSGLNPKYEGIHNELLTQGLDTRKATNIAGLHYHRDSDPEFITHAIISNEMHKLFKQKNFQKILLSEARHNMYQKVVNALGKKVRHGIEPLYFQETDNIKNMLIDMHGKPYSSYNYVVSKHPGNNGYTTEVRSADGATTSKELIKKTSHIHNLTTEMVTT